MHDDPGLVSDEVLEHVGVRELEHLEAVAVCLVEPLARFAAVAARLHDVVGAAPGERRQSRLAPREVVMVPAVRQFGPGHPDDAGGALNVDVRVVVRG